MTRPHRSVLAAMILAALCTSACSISESSESLSDSISSPFTSSSKSSGGERKQDYQADVRDFTAGYLKSNGDIAGFRSGVAKVASRHGVSNWEAEASTFTGIGQGLAKAGASRGTVEAWKASLCAGQPAGADAIERGYSGK